MASKTIYSQFSPDFFTSQAQEELLQALLENEVIYCWNTTHPESEAYLAELNREFSLDDWSPAEMETRSNKFFSSIDQLWPEEVPALITAKIDGSVVTQNSSSYQSLQMILSERFGDRIPQEMLETIAKAAKDLISSHLSLAEKLVQCVREVTSEWTTEDLLVIGRPLAYAMRGEDSQTTIDAVVSTVRSLPFSELSEMERARLSLAIARYAFSQLENISAP